MTHRLVALATVLALAATAAADWPEFRGPTGQGHVTTRKLPLTWGPDKNVAWKREVPGGGWSSPAVVGGRVFLTTAAPIDGSTSSDLDLAALCLDAASGKTLWQTPVFRQNGRTAPRIQRKNSHASPTPLVRGDRLFVHFGHMGTACLDLDGKIVWKNNTITYAPVHGNGGTPALVGDSLIFSCDGSDKRFVVALDKDSGKVIWKKDRPGRPAKGFSFSTPLAIEVNGRTQVVSPGSDVVTAHDPKTGEEIWRVRYSGYSVIPRPVCGHGMVFLSTSYDQPVALAIKVDGTGDVTDTHVVWRLERHAPHTPSMLLVGDELYAVSDKGIASCLDAKTGKVHWQQRVGLNYSASPVYADGKIYFQSEEGLGTVVRASTTFQVLARNDLKERTLASYAAADGALFVRTAEHLYRFEER